MDKQKTLERLDKTAFYAEHLPSLKINGKKESMALCPFHDDHTPSLSVNTETGLYFCPVCNDGGDLFKFYMRLKQVTFKDALNQLSGYSGQVSDKVTSKIECVYQYTDDAGNVLFEVVRYIPKTFRQRRPDGKGGYIYNMDGVQIVPYNLPKVIASDTVYICEGEKDCDALSKLDLVATTNPQGAGKWREEFGQYFTGKDIVIICDSDEPGKKHGQDVAQKLSRHVKKIKFIESLPGVPHKGDVSDWLKLPGNDKNNLIELVKDAPPWTPSVSEVVEVVNVVNDDSEEKIEITDFPVDVFPVGLKNMVQDVSNSMGVPVSVAGSISLTILGTAIGNSIKVSPKASFEVSPFLWTCVVMPTGSGKSPLLELLTRPVKGKQARAYKRYKNESKQYQLFLRAFKKNDSDELPDEPILEQYMINDSTVEALSAAFEGQPRGLLSIQDELASWLLGMNQYKASGNDRQAYLQLFNSGDWSINRKSGVRFIPSTGLGIIGNIQPETVPLVFNRESLDDGLIQRLLFVCPDTQPMKFNRNTINNLYLWDDILAWCYQMPITTDDNGFVISKILRIEGTALDTYERFYNEYGALATVLPSRYRGFISKLFLYCLKFAGILHVVQGYGNDLNGKIAESTVTDAVKLTKFYFGQIGLILKLYDRNAKTLGESQNRLVRVLYDLRGNVDKGMLRLETIVGKYNEGLPTNYHLTPEKLASVLRHSLGLITQRATGNYSYLIWEDGKMKKLFKTTLTTLTTLTEKRENLAVVNDVNDDSEKKFVDEEPINLDALEVE